MACVTPLTVYKDGRYLTVPCGWCWKCRIDHRKMWTDRIKMELMYNNGVGTFLTLTYNDNYLPQDGGLRQRDLQLFHKRLRKQLEPKKIKYYAVGEYGDETMRAHYHGLYINVDPVRDYEAIKKSWRYGHSMIKGIATHNITYVLKYLDKQVMGRYQRKKIYGDLQAPFAIMSKGIGAKYIYDNQEYIRKYHGYYDKGKIVPLPKYWYEKIDAQTKPQEVEQILEGLNKVAKSGFQTYDEMKLTENARKQYTFDIKNILEGKRV